jgi:hypothetical protein
MSGAVAWQGKKNNKKKVSLVLGGDRTGFFARDLFPLCGVALPCLARFFIMPIYYYVSCATISIPILCTGWIHRRFSTTP